MGSTPLPAEFLDLVYSLPEWLYLAPSLPDTLMAVPPRVLFAYYPQHVNRHM